MSDKLLPCPFCGGEAEYYGECDMVWVRCSRYGCYAEMISRFDEPEDAVAAWNRRTLPPPTPLTVEQLRDRIGEPVWVVYLNSNTKCWKTISRITPPTPVTDEIIGGLVMGVGFGDGAMLRDYGKTWIAYDRKPEEGSQ